MGATATAVAASRALATRAALIDDPWAEPLIKAVGMQIFVEMLDGQAENAEAESDLQRMAQGMAVRTRYFDDFLLAATSAGIRQAVGLLSAKRQSLHDAHHEVMECLGEMIWASQRSGLPPDGLAYLEAVRRRATR